MIGEPRNETAEKLTPEDLWDLVDLAESTADRYDYDAEVFERFTALADKLRRIVQEQ